MKTSLKKKKIERIMLPIDIITGATVTLKGLAQKQHTLDQWEEQRAQN